MESKFAKTMVRVLAALFALLGGIIVLTGTLLFATPFLIGPGTKPDFTGAWINATLFGFNILEYPWPAHPTVLQLWGIPALAMLKLWGLGLALVLGATVLWTVGRTGTPFVPPVVRRLRATAGCLLVYQLIFCWQYWWPSTGQVGADGVPERAFSLPYTVLSLVFCLAAPALVLCVAGMFARGCELQRQADETL